MVIRKRVEKENKGAEKKETSKKRVTEKITGKITEKKKTVRKRNRRSEKKVAETDSTKKKRGKKKSIPVNILTKQYAESKGYLIGKVEYFLFFAKRTIDLFGFIDFLALKDGKTIAIQATSDPNVSTRVDKIINHENYKKVKESWTIQVWGWGRGKDGNWTIRIIEL